MSNSPKIRLRGLYTYPNPLGKVPDGSLAVADNIVIDADGSAQSRRGLDTLTESIGDASSRANKLFNFQSHLLSHYDESTLAYLDEVGETWSEYSGAYAPIDANTTKIRSAEAASSFFFTTSTGVKKLEAYDSTPVDAGGIKALDVTAELAGSGSGFFTNNVVLDTTGNTTISSDTVTNLAATTGIAIGLYVSGTGIPDNTTVLDITGTTATLSAAATANGTAVALSFYSGSNIAYRAVWGIKDANKHVIIGVPSQRTVLTNSSSDSDDVDLSITIPTGITTAHFLQVYRSPQTVNANVEPNDELQQVYEVNPTSMEISAGVLDFTDTCPDSLRGAFLYTAASQEGALQSNNPPPLSCDIALFKSSLFYANTTSKQNLTLTILAVGGASGLAIGDTLTIDGVDYLAAATEDATLTPPKFKIYTTGTPAQNIRDTSESLVRVINRAPVTTSIYAYYLSGYGDLPGKFLLEKRELGGNTFAVTIDDHGTAFSPNLPSVGTEVSSTNEQQKNAIFISKTDKPEAVPLANVLYAGSAAFEIRRIIPLRDSLFIFKDDGIFKVAGQTPASFYVDQVDDTTKLLAPESAVNLNNTIYALTNQGVASISDTGVAIVSRDIEGDLLALFGKDLDGIKDLSWGVSYQSDRKYIMGVISEEGDTTATQMYVYNIVTQAWTRWPLSKTCGLVTNYDDKLYLGAADSNTINVERKTFSYLDYIEGATSVTISSISGTSIVVNSTTGLEVGDLLYQASDVRSVITAISGTTLTIQDAGLSWVVAAATVYTAINCVLQFQPQTGSSPETLKQFSELELFFQRARFNEITLGFYSDISQSIDSFTMEGFNSGAFGLFPFGDGPFGGELRPLPLRTYVPRLKQRCSQLNIRLTHRVAYGDFVLNGINLKIRELSDRVSR